MLSWLVALLVAVVCFALLSTWLWLPARKRIEREHGLAALADMHWRDFAYIIRRALVEKRGMHSTDSSGAQTATPSADWLMSRDRQLCLVSCKHGLSYRIGEAAIVELGTKIHLADAHCGLLLTQGSVDRDGRELAARQRIDIVEGPQLWDLVKPYVPGELENAAATHARHASVRRTGIAALGSATLAILIGIGHFSGGDAPPRPAATAPATSAAGTGQPEDSSPLVASKAVTAPRPDILAQGAEPSLVDGIDTRVENPDPDLLRRYQQQVSRLLASTEGLHSAIWITQTTVTVERAVDEVQAMALICPVLQRYPSLRTIRVQLNPRHGVDEPVRWRQCSTI